MSYPDFVRWGTVSEIASGIMEIERSKKRLKKEVDVAAEGKSLSVPLNTSEDAPSKPLLYPLHSKRLRVTVPFRQIPLVLPYAEDSIATSFSDFFHLSGSISRKSS